MTPPSAVDVLGRRVLYYQMQGADPMAALIALLDNDGLLWLTVLDSASGPIVRKRVPAITPGDQPPS
jgi:hypothetical protein